MLQRNLTHYYADGNVILCTGSHHFQVHGSILSLSSNFFAHLLSGSRSLETGTVYPCPHDVPTQKTETGADVVMSIYLSGKDPKAVELLLSALYLHTELEITWDNVDPILKLADEYEILRIVAKCDQLLRRYIGEKALEVLVLADKYRLPNTYKVSSSLVLHDYAKTSKRPEYKRLSLETRVELQAARLRYLDGVEALSQETGWRVDGVQEMCSKAQFYSFQNHRGRATTSSPSVDHMIEEPYIHEYYETSFHGFVTEAPNPPFEECDLHMLQLSETAVNLNSWSGNLFESRARELYEDDSQRSAGITWTTLHVGEEFPKVPCRSCHDSTGCTQARDRRIQEALGVSDRPVTIGDMQYFLFIELPVKEGKYSDLY
ncbi:hypothetical protein BC936DRAFT_141499 [Jimgerdemannia flammicorona]|uniref:BTB domain-containing protein n=1 Tax=Jimgerdemannia flammicorona TaxID=994334 RepID=A0A433DG33_9FUNG|nr:hypothetical protein BC936DRAFT_141499 [Jimgerdemannia flammicorona]